MAFGVVSPRTCPRCPLTGTLWYSLAVDKLSLDMLSSEQRATLDRILGEPENRPRAVAVTAERTAPRSVTSR